MLPRHWYLPIVLVALVGVSCAAPRVPQSESPETLGPPPAVRELPGEHVTPVVTPTFVATVPATVAPTAAPTRPSSTNVPIVFPSPASAPTPTNVPATTAPSASGPPGKLNLDSIMPPGPGRDLLLTNCTNCHSFVCAIIGQRNPGHWLTIKETHRMRISGMSSADNDALFQYLIDNFNDQLPQPVLPPELSNQGCTSGI